MKRNPAYLHGLPLHVEAVPLTYNRARLQLTDGVSFVARWWDYGSELEALAALQTWIEDGSAEPSGWVRAWNPDGPEPRRRRPSSVDDLARTVQAMIYAIMATPTLERLQLELAAKLDHWRCEPSTNPARTDGLVLFSSRLELVTRELGRRDDRSPLQ